MYDTPLELLQAIAAGEDSYLELKELAFEGKKVIVGGQGQASSWLARQLSAFLNTTGGALVLGVGDDGTVVGIDPDRMDALQTLIVDVARNNLEPPGDHLLEPDAMALPSDTGERLVLKVEIRPDVFALHAPIGKRPHVRMGNTTREASMEMLPRLMARRGVLLPADERPVLMAGMDDLGWDLLKAYHERRFGRPVADVDRFARNLKLVMDDERGEPHPTIAGLLMFGPAPQQHLPYARVELITYNSLVPDTDRRLDFRSFEGTLIEQLQAAVTYFRQSPFMATASSKSGQGRKDHPMYSPRALEEAVVNAVAHRDYAITGAQIRVQVFLDRIEVTSPGRLPNSLTPEDLYAGAQPSRRNQVLVGFLTDPATSPSGYAPMEGSAEGFLTMVRESERVSGRTPALRQHTEALTVTIFATQPAGPVPADEVDAV